MENLNESNSNVNYSNTYPIFNAFGAAIMWITQTMYSSMWNTIFGTSANFGGFSGGASPGGCGEGGGDDDGGKKKEPKCRGGHKFTDGNSPPASSFIRIAGLVSGMIPLDGGLPSTSGGGSGLSSISAFMGGGASSPGGGGGGSNGRAGGGGGTARCCCATGNTANGNNSTGVPLFSFPSKGYPMDFNLYYNSQKNDVSFAGHGWTGTLSRRADVTYENGDKYVAITTETGWSYRYLYDPGTGEYSLDDYVNPTTLMGNRSNWMNTSLSEITFEGDQVYAESIPQGKKFHYDVIDGKLLMIVDPVGNRLNFNYNQSTGLCMSIDDNGGEYARTVTLEYDEKRFFTGITDPYGNKTSIYYQGSLLKSIVGPEGCTISFEYDELGRMTKKTLPNGGDYTYSYDSGNKLSQVTDPLGNTTTFSYDFNLDTGLTYFKAETTITDPQEKQWIYKYGANSLLEKITDPDGNATVFVWNGLNLMRVIEGAAYTPQGFYSKGSLHSFLYDENDRIKTYIDPDGRTITLKYNEAGDVTALQESRVSYYARGDFEGNFGSDGFLLCAYDNSSGSDTDVVSLPSYVKEIEYDNDLVVRVNDGVWVDDIRANDNACLYYSGAEERRFCRWYIESGGNALDTFDMTIKMADDVTEDKEFSLAVYSHGMHRESLNGSASHAWYCRKMNFQVSDSRGVMDYQVENTFAGTWVSFPVVGKSGSDVGLTVSIDLDESIDISLTALAFDPVRESRVSYEYDSDRNLTKIIDAQNNEALFEYDSEGKLTSTTDFENLTTQYEYDDYGNLSTITYPTGTGSDMAQITLAYDSIAHYDITEITDDENNTTHLEYDTKRRLKKITFPQGDSIRYYYDIMDNLVKVRDSSGRDVVRYEYDLVNRLTRKTFAWGASAEYEYAPDGMIQKITGLRGGETHLEYYNNNLLKKITFPGGAALSYQYNESGDVTSVTLPDGNAVTYEYHLDHSLKKITLPDATTRQAFYDLYGKTSKLLDGRGNPALFTYDTLQQLQKTILLLSDVEKVIQYEYNENGSLTKVTDPSGHSTEFTRDRAGRVSRIDYPDGTFETFAFDGTGNLTSRTGGDGLTTAFEYDGDGRLTAVRLPGQGGSIEYTYDNTGRITRRDDPDGTCTKYQYDSSGRLLDVHRQSSTGVRLHHHRYIYDEAGALGGFTDVFGVPYGDGAKYAQETTLHQGGIPYDHRYKFGQLRYGSGTWGRYGEIFPGEAGEITPGQSNLPGRVKYGQGMKTSEFEYDTPGRMVEHTDFFGDVFHYGYDFAGRLALVAYPNGVITRYSYKNEGRLHQVTHSRRTSTHQGVVTEEALESFTYGYDGNGNITKITEADGSYTDYAYDEWNRLTDEHRRTEESGTVYRNQFAYDDVGNILARTSTIGEQDPQTTEYEYDGYNKLTGITCPDSTTESLEYDGNGQLIQRSKSTGEVTEYQWNTRGFLEKVILPTGEQVEYQYDGANRLVGRISSDGEDSFVQAGWSIVSEADELKRKTYYTGLSSKNSQDEFKYFHYNHRGDTVLVTDKNGEVAGKFDYEAYGNVIGSDGLNIDKVALKNVPNVFVGAYGIRYDTKTDLSYMRFRWYSPETMRFVSPDRLMGVNRYGYVAGNPLKLIDVFGAQEQALYPVGTFVNNQYQPFPYYYRPNFYAYGPANLSQSDFHPGIDLPGNANSAIIAMYSGVVIKIEPYSNENLKQYTVSIKRTYKDNCGRIHNMIVEYVHVGLLSLNIYEGARINQGESIGLLYPYRGDLYHLHLQIFLDSGYVDPAPYINIVNNPEYQMTVQAQQLDYYNTHINKRGLNIFSRQ